MQIVNEALAVQSARLARISNYYLTGALLFSALFAWLKWWPFVLAVPVGFVSGRSIGANQSCACASCTFPGTLDLKPHCKTERPDMQRRMKIKEIANSRQHRKAL